MACLMVFLLLLLTLSGSGCAEPEETLDKPSPEEADEPLDLLALNQFEPGDFENPSNCAGCHGTIHQEWTGSMHAFAWENNFYQPDYIAAFEETDGLTDIFCGECHAPVAVRTGQLPPVDGSNFDDTSRRGVSCDFCHTVTKVVETANVQSISSPGNNKLGPRGDGTSPYHEIEYSPLHADAEFCGACHNVTHPVSGAVVIDTYDDWKAGPYAEEGTRCQDCHMTPTPGVGKNPGKSASAGKEREHVATHFFSGGSVLFHQLEEMDIHAEKAKEMLQGSAKLALEGEKTSEGLRLITRVTNTGAGHSIPTGVTYIRKMWLEVTVTNNTGEVVFRSGQEIEGNHIDPDAVIYHKLFKDSEGNLTPKSWLAEDIGFERRIAPKETDEEVFEITADGDSFHVEVRLLYRSMSQDTADGLGVPNLKVPSIEMASATLNL